MRCGVFQELLSHIGFGICTVVSFLSLGASTLRGGTIPVRFAEGVSHGFLLLREVNGKVIAHGDLLQTNKNGVVESRTVFHFKDKSLSEERVAYTQQRVFSLRSYRSVQRGPSFKQDKEVSLERSGK